MFMSFKCCDHTGQPLGNRVCINVKGITNIVEIGQWVAVAQPEPPTHGDEPWDPPNTGLDRPVARRTGARRPTARAHTPDTFVLTPNCVQINTRHDNYTVVANYEELVKTLESFRNAFEEI